MDLCFITFKKCLVSFFSLFMKKIAFLGSPSTFTLSNLSSFVNFNIWSRMTFAFLKMNSLTGLSKIIVIVHSQSSWSGLGSVVLLDLPPPHFFQRGEVSCMGFWVGVNGFQLGIPQCEHGVLLVLVLFNKIYLIAKIQKIIIIEDDYNTKFRCLLNNWNLVFKLLIL